MSAHRIESLLAARLFIEPQLAGDRVVFVSNLGGHLSLYAMDDSAARCPSSCCRRRWRCRTPSSSTASSYVVIPGIDRIVVVLDRDGDERYRPYLIPLDGGFPEPLAPDTFGEVRNVHVAGVNHATNVAYLVAESVEESLGTVYRVDLAGGGVETLGRSAWVPVPRRLDRRRHAALRPSSRTPSATACSSR